MELRQFLDLGRRHRWFIVEAMVVVALLSGIFASTRTPIYSATSSVLLRPNDPSEQINPDNTPRPFANDPDRYVKAQKDIVVSESVSALAARSLHGVSTKTVQDHLSVAQSGSSDVLQISAHDVDPVAARDMANAVAKGYIENRRQSAVGGLQQAADDIEGRLRQLQTRIAQLDTLIADGSVPPGVSPSAVSSIPQGPTNPATAPTQPAEPLTGLGDLGGAPSTSESLKAARYAAAVQYESLYARQQEVLVNISLKRGEAELIALAKTPSSPVSPKPVRDGVLGAILGLALGAGISFLREKLDDRTHSAAEIQALTGLPILAQLPFDEESLKTPSRLPVVDRPLSPLAEAVRSLRTSIHFMSVERPVRVIAVASPGPGDGKSLVAANLAAAYAQSGYRTILVSGDLRKPRLTNMFPNLGASEGLTGVIANLSNGKAPTNGNGRVSETLGDLPLHATGVAQALLKTSVTNLDLLPPGATPPNPAELLGSRRMAEVLTELTSLADIVIIDTPPLLPVTDAAVLAAKADGAVLVTAVGETRREAAQRASAILESSAARILGVVINKSPVTGSAYYAAYYGEADGAVTGNSPWARLRSWRRRTPEPTSDSTPSSDQSWSFPVLPDDPSLPAPRARRRIRRATAAPAGADSAPKTAATKTTAKANPKRAKANTALPDRETGPTNGAGTDRSNSNAQSQD